MQMGFANIFNMQFVVNSTKFTCHACHSCLFNYIFMSLQHHFLVYLLMNVYFGHYFTILHNLCYSKFSKIHYLFRYLCIFAYYTLIIRTLCTFLCPQRRGTWQPKVKSRILMLIYKLHHFPDVIHR